MVNDRFKVELTERHKPLVKEGHMESSAMHFMLRTRF